MFSKIIKENPFISIILPIHNAGKFLRPCLDTLINQTLKEIEIICIVDAPIDGSELLVEEYSKKDNRIKLYYNERNLNISESRNRGLKIATGEYIGFSDHDDWRGLNMFEMLYNKAKNEQADIVFSDSYVVRDDIITRYNYKACDKEQIIASLILPMWHEENPNFLSKSVWASIYNREFLISNKIRFPERNKFYSEDTLFNLKAFLNAQKTSYLDEAFYYWNKNDNSTSDKLIDDIAEKQINYFEAIIKELQESDTVDKYKNELGALISNYIILHFSEYINSPLNTQRRLSKIINFKSLNLSKQLRYKQLTLTEKFFTRKFILHLFLLRRLLFL